MTEPSHGREHGGVRSVSSPLRSQGESGTRALHGRKGVASSGGKEHEGLPGAMVEKRGERGAFPGGESSCGGISDVVWYGQRVPWEEGHSA